MKPKKGVWSRVGSVKVPLKTFLTGCTPTLPQQVPAADPMPLSPLLKWQMKLQAVIRTLFSFNLASLNNMEGEQDGVGQEREGFIFLQLHFIWLVLCFMGFKRWIRTLSALSAYAVHWNKMASEWIIHVHNTMGGASSRLLFDVLWLKSSIAKACKKEWISSKHTCSAPIPLFFPPESYFNT